MDTTSKKEPSRTEIAARAYQLWLESGCQPDRDVAHWTQAEAELREAQPSAAHSAEGVAVVAGKAKRKKATPSKTGSL